MIYILALLLTTARPHTRIPDATYVTVSSDSTYVVRVEGKAGTFMIYRAAPNGSDHPRKVVRFEITRNGNEMIFRSSACAEPVLARLRDTVLLVLHVRGETKSLEKMMSGSDFREMDLLKLSHAELRTELQDMNGLAKETETTLGITRIPPDGPDLDSCGYFWPTDRDRQQERRVTRHHNS